MGITIQDIAEKTNFSISTISRVINNSGYVSKKTRALIEDAIEECNYVPSALAQGLSKNVTNTIGVLVPEIDNPCFSGMLKGINEICDVYGYNLMLCSTEESVNREINYLKTLRGQRIKGLIVAPTTEEFQQNKEYIDLFANFGTPVVFVDRILSDLDFDCAIFDDAQAIMDATTLLIDNGHKHIELLAGNPELFPSRMRFQGYQDGLAMHHMTFKNEWIHNSPFTQLDGYKLTKHILCKDKSEWPTAILTVNNSLTIGALRAIFEMGLSIPNDISIVGYDQIEILEYLKFNISLVEKDTAEMGRVASEILFNHMQEKEVTPTRKVILRPNLIVRGSEKYPLNRVNS